MGGAGATMPTYRDGLCELSECYAFPVGPRTDGLLACKAHGGVAPVSAARTLPVTVYERATATVLRAYVEQTKAMGGALVATALDAVGDAFVRYGLLAVARNLTPAGEALLARVEEAPVLEPTAAIVAFIRAEETRYRRNSWDSSHDAAGRERCANKASVLATVAAYIERGDHLAPPIDAPPAKEPA